MPYRTSRAEYLNREILYKQGKFFAHRIENFTEIKLKFFVTIQPGLLRIHLSFQFRRF